MAALLRHGTFVGPVRLSPQAPRVLKSGDLIRVGRIWLEVRIEQAAITQNSQLATKEIALMLVAEALAAQGENVAAELCVTEGPDAGRSLKIREFERAYVIGRGAEVSEIWHDVPGEGRRPGIDPERRSYLSRASFADPDGNTWQLQEITERLPGRV